MNILEKIAEIKASGETSLNLKDEKLRILPDELWELVHLEELILDGNVYSIFKYIISIRLVGHACRTCA